MLSADRMLIAHACRMLIGDCNPMHAVWRVTDCAVTVTVTVLIGC